MPQDLPGFYYDVNRNRYFPINANRAPYAVPIPYTSSQTFDHSAVAGRQTAQASTSVSASVRADPSKGSNVHVDRPERVRRTTQLRRDLQRSFGAAERQKCLHNLQTSSIASITLRGDSKAPFEFRGTDITALSISNEKILLGDRSGMLYITSTDMPDDSWIAHHHLGSQISSTHIHNGTMYAASLGPKPQIFISTNEYMSSLSMHSFHDMWTVHWLAPEIQDDDQTTGISHPNAVIGMKQRAVHMPSLETHRGSYIMPTNSDVFAVYKHRSQIFTGARNGSVKLFDIRVPPNAHNTLFHPCVRASRNAGGWDALSVPTNTHLGKPYSITASSSANAAHAAGHNGSVTNLRMIDEWGLLLAAMDGSLTVYDLRFCSMASGTTSSAGRPPPVMRLLGHVNSRSQGLGFLVNPTSSFVFAAGEDRKIRTWSLRTGQSISAPEPLSSNENASSRGILGSRGRPNETSATNNGRSKKSNLLQTKFSNPINSIVLSSSPSYFGSGEKQRRPQRQDGDVGQDEKEEENWFGNKEIWVASGRDLFCFESPLALS